MIFAFAIVVMFIGTRALGNNEPLFIFGYSFSIVPTDSMVGDQSDSIDPFDIVIIRKGSFDEIEIGQVIVFQGNVGGRPGLVIHRVVDMHPDGYFLTKGDNTEDYDPMDQELPSSIAQPPITPSVLQGFYHSKITFLKPIARLTTESRGLIFGGLIILLIGTIVAEVIHMFKVYKQEKEAELLVKHQEEMNEKKSLNYDEIYQEVLNEIKEKNDEKPQ